MCAYLNRHAIFSLTEELCLWVNPSPSHEQDSQHAGGSVSEYIPAFIQGTSAALPDDQLQLRNVSRLCDGHVWLTVKPDLQGTLYNVIAQCYGLHGHDTALLQFLQQYPFEGAMMDLSVMRCDVWYRFRIQRPTVQDEDELAETRTVQAMPPSVQKTPYRLYNCVLIKEDDNAEVTGLEGTLMTLKTSAI
jgi:hypothetical protein